MKRTFTLFATLSLVVSLSAASIYGTVWELTPRIKISQVTGLWQSGDIALHLFDDGHYEVDVDEDGVPDIRGEFLLSADQPPTIAISPYISRIGPEKAALFGIKRLTRNV